MTEALEPLEKLIIIQPLSKPKNGRVVGIKPETDNSTTYYIQPLSVNFGGLKNGAKMIRISSKDIENKVVTILKHKV